MKRTPLHDEHAALGARLVPFAGFEMPVQYAGVIDEHVAVRTRAGLFDVSHMGEFELEGPDALANVERLTPNSVASLQEGQAQYSAMLNERGTFVDDVLVYRRSGGRFLIVVNASNEAKDFAWVTSQLRGDCKALNVSDAWALLAVQGPNAVDVVEALSGDRVRGDVRSLGSYHFLEGPGVTVAGVPAIVSRTGYTGEDGFELYVKNEHAVALWRALLDAGKPHGITPCGLGARDTLRLEARLPLYGNDIDDEHTPIEAGLNFIVKLDKGDFIGRDALVKQKEQGPAVKLKGFEMTGREIARHGYPVLLDGAPAGVVTSGSHAPFLKTNIGLAYLPADRGLVGSALEVDVRGRRAAARIVRTPFYKRPR